MKMRGYFLVIILCLCFGVTACGKADPITVPATEDILSITVTSGKESRTYYDTDWITQIITDINNSKPTNKQSVQDVPRNDNYIKLDEVASDGASELLQDLVNDMDEASYQQYLRYHFYICEKPEFLGVSNHLLFVGELI